MNTFIDALKEEQKRIQRLIDLTEQSADAAPLTRATMSGTDSDVVATSPLLRGTDSETVGRLSLDTRRSSIYCYEVFYKDRKRVRKKYLGTVESAAVRELLAKRFCEEKLRILRSNQKLLQKLAVQYRPYDPAAVIADMPRTYQRVAEASSFGDCFNTRYEELRQWANADYPKNTMPFPEAEIYAMDGTRTRSKGECLHYNTYYERGILFRYDCLIKIKDASGQIRTVSPDFLIQCFDGTMIIIEHLGKLNSVKYSMDFAEKCHLYQRAGFILGKNFFVTSDDLNGGTDTQMIQQVADIVEGMFFGY